MIYNKNDWGDKSVSNLPEIYKEDTLYRYIKSRQKQKHLSHKNVT